MAVDRKSDYYTSSNTYTDLDGNLKTFSIVDHDRNTSRLKIWNYNRNKMELTDLQKLINLIISDRVNEDSYFIQEFDTTLADKYQYERFRKGSIVGVNQMDKPYETEEWYEDLKKLYERIQTTTIIKGND